MSKNPLFQNYGLPLPSPFDGSGVARSRSDVKSKYADTAGNVTLHAPTLRAALAVYKAINGDSADVAIGLKGSTVVVERTASDGKIDAATYDPTTGDLRAGIFADVNSAPVAYPMKKRGGKDGTVLLIAIIATSRYTGIANEELDQGFKDLEFTMSGIGTIPDIDDMFSKCGALISENIYRRIGAAGVLGDEGIKVTFPSTGNVPPFAALKMRQGAYAPDKVLYGEFQVLKGGTIKKSKEIVDITDLPGKFAFSEREFNPHEQNLIPGIESWYVVPQEVLRVCKHAKATSGSNIPMRNFMLRGPAGVGKTEGAKTMAAAMKLPYVSVTCAANSEIYDFLGQILPDVDGIEGDSIGDFGSLETPDLPTPQLPTLLDIQMDPATAYKKLTGVYIEDISEEAAFKRLIEEVRTAALRDGKNAGSEASGQRFRYVETPLVKAMKYGYLLELQEPSVIANPGVLVGLNSLLDGCKSITLPTGEVIHRHPDTVVVVTTNHDYAGCRDVNQSVISRMNLVFDLDEPSEKDMIARAKSVTGCEDDEALAMMVSIVKDIQKHCQETMITDGACGMRELVSWVQSFMITDNMLESAEYTILSSVSANAEDREVIRNTCVLPKIG